MPIVLIALAGVLLYSYSQQAKNAINDLRYEPVKITKWRIGFLNSGFDFIFKITNPTQASATVNTIDGNIYTGATLLGTFNISKPFTIPSGGSTDVSATMRASNLQALKLLYSIFLNKRLPVVEFKGGITTTLLGRAPFTYTAFLGQDLTFKKKVK